MPDSPRADGPAPAALPSLSAFASANPDQRLRDLLAFAMAVEKAQPVTREGIEDLYRQAEQELHKDAFRTLHNRVEEIRREAMEEERARTRRPAGFLKLILAALIGSLLATQALPLLRMLPWDQAQLLITRYFGGEP